MSAVLERPSTLLPLRCDRAGCPREIPLSSVWRNGVQGLHCSWLCHYEDAYDEAEHDATAEGLTGAAWRRRASTLYFERVTPGQPGYRTRRPVEEAAAA